MKAATSGGVPLKVLHVAQTAQGGVGSYLEEIAPLQIERYGRGSVRAVLPLEHAQAFPALSPEWLETFATGTGGRLMTSCRMAWLALRVMREWRPDIVHLHSTFAGLILRPVIRFLPHRPRVVYCPHGWAFDRQARKAAVIAMQGLEWLLAHACDAIVCVSVNDCARARRVGIAAHRLRVVLNGIADLQRPASGLQEAPWPERALRILFVGRLDVQKGVDVLFAAMRKLGDSAFAVVVGSSVVGDGALVGPPPANVRIAGWLSRERIAELYA
ncbi:MAG TPA: glycosyltransferase, partial [Ramlibacter sp.]|nr:glycosyltransferase [Ramlibacter sp.]